MKKKKFGKNLKLKNLKVTALEAREAPGTFFYGGDNNYVYGETSQGVCDGSVGGICSYRTQTLYCAYDVPDTNGQCSISEGSCTIGWCEGLVHNQQTQITGYSNTLSTCFLGFNGPNIPLDFIAITFNACAGVSGEGDCSKFAESDLTAACVEGLCSFSAMCNGFTSMCSGFTNTCSGFTANCDYFTSANCAGFTNGCSGWTASCDGFTANCGQWTALCSGWSQACSGWTAGGCGTFSANCPSFSASGCSGFTAAGCANWSANCPA
jgi:hypothetical protein